MNHFEEVKEKDVKSGFNIQNLLSVHENEHLIKEQEKLIAIKVREMETMKSEFDKQTEIAINLQKELEKFQEKIIQQNHVIHSLNVDKEKYNAIFEELNNQLLQLKKELNKSNQTIEEFESNLIANGDNNTNKEFLTFDSTKLIDQISHVLFSKEVILNKIHKLSLV